MERRENKAPLFLIVALVFTIALFLCLAAQSLTYSHVLRSTRDSVKLDFSQERFGGLLMALKSISREAVLENDTKSWQSFFARNKETFVSSFNSCLELEELLESEDVTFKQGAEKIFVNFNEIYDLCVAGQNQEALQRLADEEYLSLINEVALYSFDLNGQLSNKIDLDLKWQEKWSVLGILLLCVTFLVLIYIWFRVLQAYKQKIDMQLFFDQLTGLPNRRFVHKRLAEAIAIAEENDLDIGIFILDLDRFNLINDTLGHRIGDQVLKIVSLRLLEAMEDTDTVVRLGADQFIVMVDDLIDIALAARIAQRLLDSFKLPFDVEGHELFLTASIGISLYPLDTKELDMLIQHAHSAMYKAKDEGRNGYQYFTGKLNSSSLERLSLETGLRKAVKNDELRLHYQPQCDLRTGKIVGMEALVRWQHPELGLVFPGAFIALAEETGIIADIGEWVLRTACKQVKKWHDEGFEQLRMAVNLSGRQFKYYGLVDMIQGILESCSLDPKHLELELTESIVMDDFDHNGMVLKRFSEMGIHLAIDDFGTGYSSFSYLTRYSIDSLKIDQSFISNITENKDDAALTKGIIAMAHSLDLTVVAEGVETESQLNFLRQNGCDVGQGYFFGKPVSAEEFTVILQSGQIFVNEL